MDKKLLIILRTRVLTLNLLYNITVRPRQAFRSPKEVGDMQKPKALRFGDAIGIVAPAGPTPAENIYAGKKHLESMGFKVKLAPHCHLAHGYLAGSDQLRAHDLNTMFADPTVDGIICLKGGYGATKILPKMDFEMIRANPKIFVGFSDITALHIALNQKAGLVTFHGPVLTNMIKGLEGFSKRELLRAIMEPLPMGSLKNPPGIAVHALYGGRAQGVITGGNLSLIAATMGTPFEIDTKGKLLLLEEVNEEPYRVDRMLTQLATAGKFDDAVGVILGDWNNCESEAHKPSLTLLQVFEEIIIPYRKPIIYDLQVGHCTPKLTLPLGVNATLDANTGQLIIEESATTK